jgi:hypothetical protein
MSTLQELEVDSGRRLRSREPIATPAHPASPPPPGATTTEDPRFVRRAIAAGVAVWVTVLVAVLAWIL